MGDFHKDAKNYFLFREFIEQLQDCVSPVCPRKQLYFFADSFHCISLFYAQFLLTVRKHIAPVTSLLSRRRQRKRLEQLFNIFMPLGILEQQI